MPSLRDLCLRSPVVVLDAASAQVQVGVVRAPRDANWLVSAEESGVAVFECLQRLGANPGTIQTWVYCEGPGSILGVRTVATALRTWRVFGQCLVFGYSSLALVAHALGRDDVGVIADARRNTWHHYAIGTGLRRLTTEQLTGKLVMPSNFRSWSPLPPEVTPVAYSVQDLIAQTWDTDLFHPNAAPDAFLHEEPSYVTWTPQIHRAPGAGA